jgi:uncharacterized protein (TIGR02246 family)
MEDVALRRFARDYTSAWCSRDPGSVAGFFGEGGSLTINEGTPSVGRSAIADAAQGFMSAFPDMVVTMDDVRVEGDRAIYRWTLRGRNTGPGGTGRPVHISGYEEWTMGKDGRIAQSKGHFDEADYRRQLAGGGGRSRWAPAVLGGLASGAVTALLAWSRLIPDPIAFHAMALAVIAAIYVGFAFSDGRLAFIVIELLVGTGFVVLALLGLWQAPVFIAAGLVLHAIWDLVHRPRLVGTRLPGWYPAFCAAYDFVFAGAFLVLSREVAARAS